MYPSTNLIRKTALPNISNISQYCLCEISQANGMVLTVWMHVVQFLTVYNCLQKSRSRQSTQRLSPNQEENRQSTEYYEIDHLTSAKLRRHSEDHKGPLSPNYARVIAIC